MKTEDRGQDRREHPRTSVPFPVVLQSDQPPALIDSVAANVSLGGICIETDTPLPIGTDVQICILLHPHNSKIWSGGRVVRTSSGDPERPANVTLMAIEFCDHGEAAHQFLAHLLEACSYPTLL